MKSLRCQSVRSGRSSSQNRKVLEEINFENAGIIQRIHQQRSHYTYDREEYQQKKYLKKMMSKFKPIQLTSSSGFYNSRYQTVWIRNMDKHILIVLKSNNTIYQKELSLLEAENIFINCDNNMKKMIELVDVSHNGEIIFLKPFQNTSLPIKITQILHNAFCSQKVYQNSRLITSSVNRKPYGKQNWLQPIIQEEQSLTSFWE